MDNKLKKIIAREGLIFLGIVGISTATFFMVWFTKDLYMSIGELWRKHFLLIVIPFYVIYSLIRFIIWAIRTLKQRQQP